MNGKKLIIIRHAETQNSKDRRYQSPDSAILPVSRRRVENTKRKLLDLGASEIFVSELNRSAQTAELFDLPTKRTELLNEFREPSSLFDKQITASSSYIFDVIEKYDSNWGYAREDGESLKELIDRTFAFRVEVENSDKELIVCVGHGFYMRIFALLTIIGREEVISRMLSSALNMKMEKLNYASFILKEGRWTIETWNGSIEAVSS